MDQDTRRFSVWSAAALGLLIAISIVVLVGYEPTRSLFCYRYEAARALDPSCFRNFISEYQTLITGILAVGAAYATITEMRRADRSTAERHREAMDVATAPLRLKAARWVSRVRGDVKFFNESYNRLVVNPVFQMNAESWDKTAGAMLVETVTACKQVIEALKSDQTVQAREMFSVELSNAADAVIFYGSIISGVVPGNPLAFITSTNVLEKPSWYTPVFVHALNQCQVSTLVLLEEVDTWHGDNGGRRTASP